MSLNKETKRELFDACCCFGVISGVAKVTLRLCALTRAVILVIEDA